MKAFRWFTRLTEGIEELGRALERIARLQEELGPALDRIEVLERTRHQFEAECEGMLLKADNTLKAARNAESRERHLKKANERLADPLAEAGEEEAERDVFPGYVAPGEGAAVPPVRLALATNNKAHAVRAKFGI